MYPCSRSNQITYEYFCVLGGLANPQVAKMHCHNGSHTYFTYHLITQP